MKEAQQKAIVIGAGIAGCSTAYALSQRNIAVTLIERHHEVAQAASGNPIAMLYPKFNSGLSVLSKIAYSGYEYTLSLLKQLPNNHEIYDLCGQIQLAYNQREQEKQTQLIAENKNLNILRPITAMEASEKANIALTYGGLYLSESGWVKPLSLCQYLTQSILITKVMNNSALNLQQQGNRWYVITDKKQSFEADIVVICNATDITQFDQCKTIPITPVRGQVNFFQATDISKKMKTVICTDHYLSPCVDQLHSIGTSYAPNDMNSALSKHDTNNNLEAIKLISPAMFSSIQQDQIKGRVAWRSATRDYMPLAGQLIDEVAIKKAPPRYNAKPEDLPWLKGLYLNAGHGSKGMITAPLCAELIANFIKNEPLVIDPKMAARLNPSRFLLRSMGLKQIAQTLI